MAVPKVRNRSMSSDSGILLAGMIIYRNDSYCIPQIQKNRWNPYPSTLSPYICKFRKIILLLKIYTPQNLHMGVSENGGTPKSSNIIGISIINHPFWSTPIFGNTHILHSTGPFQKETRLNQPECFRCELLVSGRVKIYSPFVEVFFCFLPEGP